MVYPNCPKCENSSTAMSIVDVEIAGENFKGVQCNDCGHFVAIYKDYDDVINRIKDSIDDLDRRIED